MRGASPRRGGVEVRVDHFRGDTARFIELLDDVVDKAACLQDIGRVGDEENFPEVLGAIGGFEGVDAVFAHDESFD